MSVTVRFAPSPTGLLHIGGVRTALFNWLFARHEGGEFRLRIENTDTSREVAEATEQIRESFRWLGLHWDGNVTFQLDRMERCQEEARRLLAEGKAYEDEGAIRIRMPDEGVTGWDDLIRGHIEYPNEELEDLVAIRSDGRPTYNFASPVEDWLDGITHVIRGDDHISNTPKQIRILEALGAPVPRYGHVPSILGPDGKKLSKRHGAIGVQEFRDEGYIPEALVNYLALLGWSYDEKTEIMTLDELVDRFTLERVGAGPATFDYQKLDHFNGVHLRALPPDEYAERLVAYVRELGLDWDEETVRAAAPLAQEKISRLGQFPDYARFLFEEPEPLPVDGELVEAAREALADVEPFTSENIEQALRALADRLELSPRKAFQPIRVAVTGSTVSPGLFESLELLGKEVALSRLSAAAAAAA
ncbi:MAG TPA: glutamate--tRNA ligase [Gaiellaceae bacterium]|nr:glutamate--tRNA ligase [Gaiellaceae bacterium]